MHTFVPPPVQDRYWQIVEFELNAALEMEMESLKRERDERARELAIEMKSSLDAFARVSPSGDS